MAEVLGQDPIEQDPLSKPSMSQPGTGNESEIRLQKLKSAYDKVQASGADAPSQSFNLPQNVSEEQFRKRLGSDYNIQGANLTDDLAAAQSWQEQIFYSAPTRALVKGATEALKIPGALAGMVNAVANITDPNYSIGEAFNNGYIMALDRLNDKFQNQVAPVYESEAVRDGDIWERMGSTSFWAKEGADGAGFLLGMMAPGALLRWSGAGSKIAKGFLGLEKLTKPGTKLENLYNATEKAARRYDMFTSAIVNTGFEAGIESQQAFNEYLKSNPDDIEGASKVARNTFIANNAILLLPNIIDQQLLFKGWKYGAKGADEGIGGSGVKKLLTESIKKGSQEGGEALAKTGPRGAFDIGLDITKTLAKGSAKEGLFEEGMQYAAAEQAKDTEEVFNPLSVLGEYLEQIMAPTKGNTEMWSGIVLGGILGGGMQAIGDIRQAGRETKVANEYATLLNKNFADFNKNLGELAETDADGNKLMEKDKDGKNTGRYKLDISKVMAAGAGVIKYNWLREKYNRAAANGDEALADHIQEMMRFNYARNWLKLEGGQELFKEHIKEWAKAENERQAEAKGTAAWSVEDLTKDIESKIPMYQDVVDKVTNTHRLSFDVQGSKATVNDLKDFSANLLGEKITHKFDVEYSKAKVKEINDKLNTLVMKSGINNRALELVSEDLFKKSSKDFMTKADVDASKAKIQSLIDTLNSDGILDKTEAEEAERLLTDKLKMIVMEGKARYDLDKTFDNKYQQKAFDAKMKQKKEAEAAIAGAEAAKEESEVAGSEILDPALKKFHETSLFREERALDQSNRKTYVGGELKEEPFTGKIKQVTHRAKVEATIKDKATGEEKVIQFIPGNPTSKGKMGFVIVSENSEGAEVLGDRGEFTDMKNLSLSKAKYEVVGEIRTIETAEQRMRKSQLAATMEKLESMIDSYNETVADNEAKLVKVRAEIDKNAIELKEADLAYKEALKAADKKLTDKNVVKLYKKLSKLQKQKVELKQTRTNAIRNLEKNKKRRFAIVQELRDFKKSPIATFDEIEKIIQSNSDLEEQVSIQLGEMDTEIANLDEIIAKYMPLFKGYNTQIAKLLGITDVAKEAGVLSTDADMTKLSKISDYLLEKIDDFIYESGEDFTYQLAEEVATIAQQLTKIRGQVLDSESRLTELAQKKDELDEKRVAYRTMKKAYISRWKDIMDIYEKNTVKYFKTKDIVEVSLIEAEESETDIEKALRLAGADEKFNAGRMEESLHAYEDFSSFLYLSMNQDEARDDDNVARWAVFVNNYAGLRLKSNPKLPRYKLKIMSFDEVRKIKGAVRDQFTFVIKDKVEGSDGKATYKVRKLTVSQVEKEAIKDKTIYEKARQDIKVAVVHQEDANKFFLVDPYGTPVHGKGKHNVVFSSLGEATIERDTKLGRAGKSLRFDTSKAIRERMGLVAKNMGYKEIDDTNRDIIGKQASEDIDKEVEENRVKFEEFRNDIIKGKKKGEIIHIRSISPGKFIEEKADWTSLVNGFGQPMQYWDFTQYRPVVNKDTGEFEAKPINVPYVGMRTLYPGMTYLSSRSTKSQLIPVYQNTLGETGDVDNILNIIRYIASGKANSKAYLDYLMTVIYVQNHPHEENSQSRMFFEKLTDSSGKVVAKKYSKLHFGATGVVTAEQLRTGQGLADLKAYLSQKYWNFDKLAASDKARKPFIEMNVDAQLNALPTKTWRTVDNGYIGFLFSTEGGRKSKGRIRVRPLPKGKNGSFLLAKDPQFKNRAIKGSLTYKTLEEYTEGTTETRAAKTVLGKDAAFLADIKKELGHDDITLFKMTLTSPTGVTKSLHLLRDNKTGSAENFHPIFVKHKYAAGDIKDPGVSEAGKNLRDQMNSKTWSGTFASFSVLGDTQVTAEVVPLDKTVAPAASKTKVLKTSTQVLEDKKSEAEGKMKYLIPKIKSAADASARLNLIGALMEDLTGDSPLSIANTKEGFLYLMSKDNWEIDTKLSPADIESANEEAILGAIQDLLGQLDFDEVVEEVKEPKAKVDLGLGTRKMPIAEETEEEEDLNDEASLKEMEKAFSILERDDATQAASYMERAERSWSNDSGLDEENPFSSPNADAAITEMKKNGTYVSTMRPIAIGLFTQDINEDSSLEVKSFFGKKPEAPKKEKKAVPAEINVYYGSNENKELSNFAVRPFTIKIGDMVDMGTLSDIKVDQKFTTVEQAFQYYKALLAQANSIAREGLGLPNQNADQMARNLAIKEEMKTANPSEAKALGRKLILTKADVKEWDEISGDLMTALIYQSFDQNPKSIPALLATGDAKITHTQDKTKWATMFPEALMAVREVIRKQEENAGPTLRLANNEEGDYTLEEIEEVKTWWSNKFPQIPLETVEGLIDGKAWGKLLKSARVLISTSAAEGTGYHEAWHVWNLLFNSEKSRKELYDEARSRTGKDMTDKQAEEFLADEFMDYMLEGTAYKFNKGEEVKKTIFQRMLAYIKHFIYKLTGKKLGEERTDNILKAFKTIDEGRFYAPLNELSESWSRVDGVSARFQQAMVDDMDVRFFNMLMGDLANDGDMLLNFDTKVGKLYSDLKDVYVRDNVKEEAKGKSPKYSVLVQKWEAFVLQHKQRLIQYQIIMPGLSNTNDAVDEDDQTRNLADWKEPFHQSMKDTTSVPIRLLVASLPSVSGYNKKKGSWIRTVVLPFRSLVNTQYDKMMNVLYGQLTGVTNTTDLLNRLKALASKYPELEIMYDALSHDTMTSKSLLSMAFKSFATNRNEVVLQILDHSGFSINKDLVAQTDRDVVRNAWITEGQSLAKNNSTKYIKWNGSDYVLDVKALDDILAARAYGDTSMNILSGLGITYGTGEDNISRKYFSETSEVTEFLNRLAEALEPIAKKNAVVTLNSLYDRNVFKFQAELNSMAAMASISTTNDVDLMYFNQEGNLEWAITKNTHASNIKNRLKEVTRNAYANKNSKKKPSPFTAELELLRPFDGVSGNMYTRSSQLLREANEGTLDIAYYLVKGADTIFKDGAELNELTNPQYLATSFEMILNNIILFKRSADRGPEQAFKWRETNWGVTEANFVEDSKDYLIDEIATSFGVRTGKSEYGADIDNYGQNARELRTFSFIHDSFFQTEAIPTFDEYLKDKKLTALLGATPAKIVQMAEAYYNENKLAIESATENFLKYNKKTTYDVLIENKIIIKTMSGGIPSYQVPGLNLQSMGFEVDRNNEINQDDVDTLLMVHSYNYFFGMQEQYKVFFGDPASYKSFTDLDKRTTSSMSTTTLTANDQEFVDFLNSDGNPYKKVNGMPYSKNVNAVVINTVVNDENDDFLKGISELYAAAEIVDGAMFGTLDFIRDFGLRTAKWSEGKEATYQFQMQKFVIEVINNPELSAIWPGASKDMFKDGGIFAMHTNGKYTGRPHFKGQELNELSEVMEQIPHMKTLGVGNLANSNTKMYVSPSFINKMSVTSILPSDISFAAKKLLASMLQNNIDKFGDQKSFKASSYVNQMDIRKGDLFDESTALTQMSYSDYGSQLDIQEEEHGSVTDSQQKACLQYTDVFDKGVLKNESLKGQFEGYHNTINNLTDHNFEKAIDDLAVAEDANGNYFLPEENADKFKELMIDMFNKRLLPDNIIDGLTEVIDSEQKVFDLFTDHKKAAAVLTALIKNRVIKRKVKGEMLVQEPDLLYNLGGKRLKFYTPGKDGNLLRAECMISLPAEFIPMARKLGGLDRLNYLLSKGKLPKEMYEIVANRVPTAKINTIEALTIVKFLPPSAGARIVLPAEIVVKTGSDYDIDKLTTYFNNFEMHKGKLKLDADGLPIPLDPNDQTNPKAMENSMNLFTATAVLNKDRIGSFLAPNSASTIAKLAKEFYVPTSAMELAEKQFANKGTSTILWAYNGKKALDFWEGVRGVAYGAAQNTVHPFLQFSPVHIKDNVVRFFFEGQELGENERYTSGHITDHDNETISTNYEAFLVAFVDVAKDPFVINLLGTLDTFSIFAFLNRFGKADSVGIKQIAALVSNPFVRKYIKEMQVTKSLFAKHNPYLGKKDWDDKKNRYVDRWAEENMGFKSDVYDRITFGIGKLSKSPTTYIDSVTYSLGKYLTSSGAEKEKYRKEIEAKYKKYDYKYLTTEQLNSKSKSVGIQALDNFMMYELLAKHNLSLNSLLRPYAAGGFPKSVEGLMAKQTNKENSLEKSIFEPFDIVSTTNNTFIKSHEKVYNKSIDVLGWTSLMYKYPTIRGYFKTLMKEIPITTSKDKVEKIVEAYKSNFLTYLWVLSLSNDNGSVRDLYKDLFIGQNSIPAKLAALNQSGKISGEVFDYLRPVVDEWDPNTQTTKENGYINTFNKDYGLSMDNVLVASFQDLFKNGDTEVKEFLGLLVHFAVLQSGLRNSQYSFMKLIPNQIFIPEFDRKISNLATKYNEFSSADFVNLLESFTDQFYRHNAADSDIVYRSSTVIEGLTRFIDSKIDPEQDLEVRAKKLSFKRNERESSNKYISVRYTSLTRSEKAKYLKEKKRVPYDILLYKRDSLDPSVNNPKAPRTFTLVGKLGDGLRMSEFYPSGTPKSILKVNSYENLKKEAEESPITSVKVKSGATISFQESKYSGYTERTAKNASADATIAFAVNFKSRGEELTHDSVIAHKKEYIPIDLTDLEVDATLIKHIALKLNKANKGKKEITVNIAGNSIRTLGSKYSQEELDDFMFRIFKGLRASKDLTKTIVSVRSGGQTGMDEAGIKGAAQSGINAFVYAPKGWQIRDEKGKDVPMDEADFKARFLNISERNSGATTGAVTKIAAKPKSKFRKQYQAAYGTEYTAPIPELDAAMEDFFAAHGYTKHVVDRIVDHTGTLVPAIAATDIYNKTVEVVDGTANLTQLPEEAAHLYIGMLSKTDNLYKSMYANIVNYPIYKKVVDIYDKLYKTDEVSTKEAKMREEAMGKLIAERIVEGFNAGITERQVKQVETWWSLLWKKIKDIVSFTRKDSYAKAAYEILNSGIKNLVTQKVEVESEMNEDEMPEPKMYQANPFLSAEQEWKELPLIAKGIYKYDYFRTIDQAETAFEIYKDRFGTENVTLHSITDNKYRMKIAVKKPTYAGDPAQVAIDQQNVAMSNIREMSKSPEGYTSENVLRDFATYFPDLAWLSDSEKEMLMGSIENGDNQIVCEF